MTATPAPADSTPITTTEVLRNKITNLLVSRSKKSQETAVSRGEDKVQLSPKKRFNFAIGFVMAAGPGHEVEGWENNEKGLKIEAESNSTIETTIQQRKRHGSVSYEHSAIVAASAPEIGNDNKGRLMMEKMRWNSGEGMGLGENKGILLPIEQKIKFGRAGLGDMGDSGEVSGVVYGFG